LIEAERWARRALELDDQEPVSHMALGNVLLWQRDHKGALAEFGHMMALDPNFAQGHTATGLALMYTGEPARALEPFAKAMRLDPHYPDIVLHFLAQANFSLEKYERRAAASGSHRTQPWHRRQPHAVGILLWSSRARG
jgi:adenylate cyclase